MDKDFYINVKNNRSVLNYFTSIQGSSFYTQLGDEPLRKAYKDQSLMYGPFVDSFTSVFGLPKVLVLGDTGKTTLLKYVMLCLTYTGGDNLTKMQMGERIPFYFDILNMTINGAFIPVNLSADALYYTLSFPFGEYASTIFETGQALIMVDNVDCFRDLDTALLFFGAFQDLLTRYPRCTLVYTAAKASYRGLLMRECEDSSFAPYFLV